MMKMLSRPKIKILMAFLLPCLLLTSTVSEASRDDFYAGLWSGDGLKLELQKSGELYAGRVQWQGKSLPLDGHIQSGVFWGEVRDGNTLYSFLIEKQATGIDFTIDSQTYRLSKEDRGGNARQLQTRRQSAKMEATGKKTQQPGAVNSQAFKQNGTLVFKRVPISDQGGWIGGSAGSLLAPVDWQVKAGIEWYYHPTMPGRMVFEAVSPDGRHRIAMYPHLTFFYGPTMVAMQEGRSQYYGNTYLRPFGDAQRLIEQVILPWIHPDRQFQIQGSEQLPAYAQAVLAMNSEPGVRSQADARRVRIAYHQNGRQVVEDVSTVYAVQQVGPVIYWQAQFVTTVRSDAQQIEAVSRIQAAMMDSLRIDPKWFNKFLQIGESFQRLAAANVQLAANQSRIISELSDYITENRRQTYENIQRSFDRVNRQFSQHIRGVDTWQNHHGETMELPSGYDQGWQSDNGTVLVTTNPNLNPNSNPQFNNQNWHKMKRG